MKRALASKDFLAIFRLDWVLINNSFIFRQTLKLTPQSSEALYKVKKKTISFLF